MVSEYSIESLLKAYIDGNELNFHHTLKSSEIDSIINDYEKVFGEHDYCVIKMRAKPTEKFAPKVVISPS